MNTSFSFENAKGSRTSSAVGRLVKLSEDFVIIGGGPVGLAMAIGLKLRGESVRVLERGSREEASFNFTLVTRSIALLETLGITIRDSCAPIFGREIWRQDGRHSFHSYGLRKTDCLYSLPRNKLIEALRVRAAQLGIEISEGWGVVKLNSNGTLLAETPSGPVTISARRFVGADGCNSRIRDDIVRLADTAADRRPDGFLYAVTHIAAPDAKREGVRSDRIHFSTGAGGIDIGVGNADGSISLLLERPAFGVSLDSESSILQTFMEGPPPILRNLVQNLPEQIMESPIRAFKYASSGAYSHGNVILAGDAARCWPPYLGQGLNSGLKDVASFLDIWKSSGRNWRETLRRYETDRREYARHLTHLSETHGKMLFSGEFGSSRWRLRDRIERIAERVAGHRNVYQQLVFDLDLSPTKDGQIRQAQRVLERAFSG